MTVETDLAAIESMVEGGRLWGLELDPRYRVAAATIELADESAVAMALSDPRVQLSLYPVADILVRLSRDAAGERVVEQFEIEQLLAVVERFDGPRVSGPLFDTGGSELPPPFSLQGRTSALDGRLHRFDVLLEDGEGRELNVQITFDEVRLRDSSGNDLDLAR